MRRGAMSTDNGNRKMTIGVKKIPASLRQHLRDANIKDTDVSSITTKLKERMSANIISYLQLSILKIRPTTSTHNHRQLDTHEARTMYSSSLSERVDSLHD